MNVCMLLYYLTFLFVHKFQNIKYKTVYTERANALFELKLKKEQKNAIDRSSSRCDLKM